jgi:hypothetical protein
MRLASGLFDLLTTVGFAATLMFPGRQSSARTYMPVKTGAWRRQSVKLWSLKQEPRTCHKRLFFGER